MKVYGNDPEAEKRYSPAHCLSATPLAIIGAPDPEHIDTSYVERQNLNVRRFTRLTNAFCKKFENHVHAGVFPLHYNLCRIHQTLRVTPEMEAGISQHVWSIRETVNLIDPSSTIQQIAA